MQRNSWIPKAATLAVFVLAAFALATSAPAPLVVTNAPSLSSAAGPFAACDGSALTANGEFAMPDSTAVSQPDGSDAACRRAPECSVDSDCDVLCGGVGLGKCVHSSCPVRICKCH